MSLRREWPSWAVCGPVNGFDLRRVPSDSRSTNCVSISMTAESSAADAQSRTTAAVAWEILEPGRSTIRSVSTKKGQFDLNQLSRWIDNARSDRHLTWAAISQEVGVATSTIRRFATASDAEADGVLALIGWLGVPPEQFVVNSKVDGIPLPPAGGGLIRVDMTLFADLLPRPRRARPGARTTIQQLVTAAQASEVPLASLTRWSPI